LDNLLHERNGVSFEKMMEVCSALYLCSSFVLNFALQQPQQSSVSEQVLLTTERVGILATRSLDSNSNTTVSMGIQRLNIGKD